MIGAARISRSPRDGRRGGRVDPAHRQHDAQPPRSRAPSTPGAPGAAGPAAGPARRRPAGRCRRSAPRGRAARLEPGVVRGGVADVQHAEADGAEQGPAGDRLQRPARAGRARSTSQASAPPIANRHAISVSQSTPVAYTGFANRPPEPNAMALTTTSAMPAAGPIHGPRVSEVPPPDTAADRPFGRPRVHWPRDRTHRARVGRARPRPRGRATGRGRPAAAGDRGAGLVHRRLPAGHPANRAPAIPCS